MGDRRRDASESRFAAYVEGLVRVIGHADRARPLRDYCMGLMMPCERKSVEPMAAVTAPARVSRSFWLASFTGLVAAIGPASRLRRRYADAPAGAFILCAEIALVGRPRQSWHR